MLLALAVAASTSGLVYFLVLWLTSRRALRRLTPVEYAIAEMADDRHRRGRASLRERVRHEMLVRGYRGGAAPLVLVVGLAWLAGVASLRLLGVNIWAALIIAAPAVAGAALLGLSRAGARRRRDFNSQLSQLFNLLAGQLEAGTSLQRALPSVTSSLPDPLRAELAAALAGGATTDLLAAAAALEAKYPSRAMTLFHAALQVNDDLGGGKLAGTLAQLAGIVEREKELAQEAAGTLAETRSEFMAILIVLSGIALFTVGSNLSAFLNPVALMVMTGAVGNFALGVWRAQRLTRPARV